MGALASVTPWIPEDDLLLKNAIEAGASLESLAKGAVQFSRRFTIKELQDRWRSLLYDPTISIEAAVQMKEFERYASNLPLKSGRVDTSKENKCIQGKRKAESVRRCYYAMRKRICNEPLPGDLGFLVQPGDFICKGEAPGANSMLGHPAENHFVVENANFGDLHHVFSQDTRNIAPTCSLGDFLIEQQKTLEGSIELNAGHKEIPHMIGNNVASGIMHHIIPSEELVGPGIFEANGIESNPECNSKEIMCSVFGGNVIFSSPISDHLTSFNHLQYTSPPPAMPDWKPIEAIPVLGMPDDVSTRGNNMQNGDPFGISDECGSDKGTSEYDVIPTDTEFDNHILCDDFKNSTGCTEGLFDEITDTLFNFTPSDEEILNIDGEKDVIHKSFYDGLSLLLNSPGDVNTDNMPNIPEQQAPVAPDAIPDILGNKGPEENNTADCHLGDIDHLCNSATHVPLFASVVNLQLPEHHDGVFFCLLNAEDPDIPCNDDIVFPSKPRPASANRRTQNEANSPALNGKDNADNQTGGKGNGTMKRDLKQFGKLRPTSQTQGSEIRLNHRTDEFGIKFESFRGESQNVSRNSSASSGGPSQSGLVVKKEPSDSTIVRQPGCVTDESERVSSLGHAQADVGCVVGQSGHVSGLGHLQAGFSGTSQEGQAPSDMRNQDLYALKSANSITLESGGDPLLSDPEELFSDSEADIPCFSDIESMILEMDLGPDNQDSFSSREVAKYQHEDAKRAIIRLEQNAHSYMQRAIASHGAFAILYGHHSKHYIKKAEVLLGRATDDVLVDIDLGREGHPNKISRHQAIIKMDKDGTFNLKNLGKGSVYVNNEELFSGQSLVLRSNCLIEIRGMPFIFETNQSRVRQYLDSAA